MVPKGAKEPEFKPANLDWAKLENKYHFSQTCSTCEPSYPLLTSFQPNYEEYAKIIRENAKYKGLITVGNYRASSQIRKILTKTYNLPRSRFTIQILKSKGDEETIIENLYIITRE